MKTFQSTIQDIAENYAYSCKEKGNSIDGNWNKITREEEAELIALAASDNEMHSILIAAIRERLCEKLDDICWEDHFSEDYEKDDLGIYDPMQTA